MNTEIKRLINDALTFYEMRYVSEMVVENPADHDVIVKNPADDDVMVRNSADDNVKRQYDVGMKVPQNTHIWFWFHIR